MTTKTEQILSSLEKMGNMNYRDIDVKQTEGEIVNVLMNTQSLSDAAVNKLMEKMDEETIAEIFNSAAALLVYAALINEGMAGPLEFMLDDERAFRYFSHTLCITVIGMLLEEGVLK